MTERELMFEFAVRDEYGDLMEWSCGCPRLFSTEKSAEIYADFAAEFADNDRTVVRRYVTEWELV